MTQAMLRIRVFGAWLAFWIVTTIAVVLAPLLRSDEAIGDEQVVPAILSVSSVWLPPLTCFATFWFPTEQQKQARATRINKERVIGAYALTLAYLLLVLMLVLRPIYMVSYESASAELPTGVSFEEQLAAAVNYALLVSPIALAPTIWLTGVSPSAK